MEQDSDIVFNIFISNAMVREKIIPQQKNNTLLLAFFMDYLYRDSKKKQFLHFQAPSPSTIQTVENMIEECIKQRLFYQNMADAALMMLLSQLSRDYYSSHTINPFKRSTDTLCYEIITYIAQNCSHITLKSLAERFQYTPAYLSRLIRQKTSKTFIQLVVKHKLQRAAEFLTETDMTITDIAQATGFGDIPHFIKIFKKEYNVTPTEYRKTHKKP